MYVILSFDPPMHYLFSLCSRTHCQKPFEHLCVLIVMGLYATLKITNNSSDMKIVICKFSCAIW